MSVDQMLRASGGQNVRRKILWVQRKRKAGTANLMKQSPKKMVNGVKPQTGGRGWPWPFQRVKMGDIFRLKGEREGAL